MHLKKKKKKANKSRSSEPFYMWIYEMKPLSTSVILTYNEICLRLPSIMGERGIWQLVFILSRARQNCSFCAGLGVGHGKLKIFVLCRLRGKPWETETVHHFVQTWG